MRATVQIAPDGMVIANLDSDDYAADDDDRALMNLRADGRHCGEICVDRACPTCGEYLPLPDSIVLGSE